MTKTAEDYGLEIVEELPEAPERGYRVSAVAVTLQNMADAYDAGALKAGQLIKLGQWNARATASTVARNIANGKIVVPEGYEFQFEARRYMVDVPVDEDGDDGEVMSVKVSGLFAQILG
jgi:hypothetical protein